MIIGIGYRISGIGFRVPIVGHWVSGIGYQISGMALGIGYRAPTEGSKSWRTPTLLRIILNAPGAGVAVEGTMVLAIGCYEHRVVGIEYRISGIENRVWGMGYCLSGIKHRASGIGYRVWGIGCVGKEPTVRGSRFSSG